MFVSQEEQGSNQVSKFDIDCYEPTIGSGGDGELEKLIIRLNKASERDNGPRGRVWCRRMILSSKEPVDIFADVRGEADEIRRRLWNLIDETPNVDWVLETMANALANVAKLVPSLWLPGVATGQGGKLPENVRVVMGRSFSGEELLRVMIMGTVTK